MCSDPILMSGGGITVGAMPSSTNCNQPKELCSMENESIPKVRKPYTITKQREKWTEEEHIKFLEALRLFGRTWRRIEEHIGTKNAVQIRSHAQKFFSKVVKESADSSTGSMKPVEIPPPRPKRKPLHPYPRKFGNVSNKEVRVLQKTERSMLPNESVSDQENNSPKSVLSAFGSGMLGSSSSDIPNCHTSSDSSSVVTNPADLEFTEQEIGCKLQLSLAEETGCHSAPSVSDALSLGCKSDTEPNPVSRTTSFQLFGRTVFIAQSDKTNTSIVGDAPQCHAPSQFTDDDNTQGHKGNDMQTPAPTQIGNVTSNEFYGDTYNSSWSPWSCGVPPIYYCLPPQQEFTDAANGISAPIPLWAFYSGLPFPVVQTSELFLQRCPHDPQEEHSYTKELQEGSRSGSNTTISNGETEMRESSSDATKCDFIQDKPSFTGPKFSPEKKLKGFVPYKRSLVQREEQEEADIDQQRECQRSF